MTLKTTLATFILFIGFLIGLKAQHANGGGLLETKLQVTVRDELGNEVEGAEVKLYGNEEDFSASRNPIMPTEATDAKGKVEFKGLEEKGYYISVEKGDANNFGLGVKVEPLKANRKNRSTIIISEGL